MEKRSQTIFIIVVALVIGGLIWLLGITYTLSPEKPLGACYVGGCSAQICSDQPDAVSTCEYRPEYACYKTATCERQRTGKCGWTETVELKACLAGKN